jgi:hypothetical protein
VVVLLFIYLVENMNSLGRVVAFGIGLVVCIILTIYLMVNGFKAQQVE